MALYEWGGPEIHSTGAGTANNPSTATLVAEIDSTQLGIVTGAATVGGKNGRTSPARLMATLGGSTSCDWRLEKSVSSTLADAPNFLVPSILTPTGQSGVYQFSIMVEPGDRIRARLNSSLTGSASAFLQVDPLV